MEFIKKCIYYIHYENPLHTVIAISGLCLRCWLFDFFVQTTFSFCWYIVVTLIGFVLNFLLSKPLHYLSFEVVGLFYTSGDNPVLGSISYTIVYTIIGFVFVALAGLVVKMIF